jgi:hypothetical protein
VLVLLLQSLLSSAPLPDGGCELWHGDIWGNDPNVKTRLMVCRRKDQLCGELEWTGQSGHNVRQLVGAVDGDALELKDVRFIVDRPRGGWRFCLIGRYRLKTSPKSGALEGRYVSTACRDEAELTLRPVAKPEQPVLVSCFDR